MEVEVTSDDEFRRRENKIFKKSRKFSLKKSEVRGRGTRDDK